MLLKCGFKIDIEKIPARLLGIIIKFQNEYEKKRWGE